MTCDRLVFQLAGTDFKPTRSASIRATRPDDDSRGGRLNLGHTGNTAEATTSAPQFVQVLSPNGLEKLEHDATVNVTWRTNGVRSPVGYYRDAILADRRMRTTASATPPAVGAGQCPGRPARHLRRRRRRRASKGRCRFDIDGGASFDGINDHVAAAGRLRRLHRRLLVRGVGLPDVGGSWQRLLRPRQRGRQRQRRSSPRGDDEHAATSTSSSAAAARRRCARPTRSS